MSLDRHLHKFAVIDDGLGRGAFPASEASRKRLSGRCGWQTKLVKRDRMSEWKGWHRIKFVVLSLAAGDMKISIALQLQPAKFIDA